jgi:hypothetical protein
MKTGVETEAEVKALLVTVNEALNKLIVCLGARQRTDTDMDRLPFVFIVFDEAHSLTELRTSSNRTPFLELRSALKNVRSIRLFAFFLSTLSKISQFAVPIGIDRFDMMVGSIPSHNFSDLGFDHLMHDRNIFEKFKTIDDVTSSECITHMGRPM